MDDINKIDHQGPYFHIELLKYYYEFINFHKIEENKPDQYLHFDFDSGVYIITYDDLISKAQAETKKLTDKYDE
jgi:hypothetical protein